MKTIIVGYGIQGKKRHSFLGEDFVGIVDPESNKANYKNICEVPLQNYDSALVCTPNSVKYDILKFLLENNKNILVEKPLLLSKNQLLNLHNIQKESIFYTAYNHRFEPHFMTVKELLDKKSIGHIYKCRLFYGNGTARDVKDSQWRDQGDGVISDLGSHLLDTVKYWFEDQVGPFKTVFENRFENKAPDHAIMFSSYGNVFCELEMSLVSWRNSFKCDMYGSDGSIHIESLCKWGPSTLTVRKRVKPSGRPTEQSETLLKHDPTWLDEYNYFKKLCKNSPAWNNLDNDLWIYGNLKC